MDPDIHAWEAWEGRRELNPDHDPDGRKCLLARIRDERARLGTEHATGVELSSFGAPFRILAANVDSTRRTAEQGLGLAELYVDRAKAYGFSEADVAEVRAFFDECESVLRF